MTTGATPPANTVAFRLSADSGRKAAASPGATEGFAPTWNPATEGTGAAMTRAEVESGQFQGDIPPFRLVGITAALFGYGVYQSQPPASSAPPGPGPSAAPPDSPPPTPSPEPSGPATPTSAGSLPWIEGPWIRASGGPGQATEVAVDVPAGWQGRLQFTLGPIVGTDSGTSSTLWITDGENVVAGPVRGHYYGNIATSDLEGGKRYYLRVEYDVPTTMSVGLIHHP